MVNKVFSYLTILFLSSFMFSSCITPGSITHEQEQQASETSGTVNNLELTVANSAQAAEELKAGQEQIKGKLEKLEHDLNFKMDELNKRLDQLTGVQTTASQPQPIADAQTVDKQKVAGGQTVTDTNIQNKQFIPDTTTNSNSNSNSKMVLQKEVAKEPSVTDLSKISLDQRYKTAKKLEQERKYDEAEKYYTSMVGIPSKWYDEKARFFLGSMYYDMNKRQEAIVALQDFIDKYPSSRNVPKAILIQADSFVALDQKSNAQIFYKDLITRFPKTKEAEKAKTSLKKL